MNKSDSETCLIANYDHSGTDDADRFHNELPLFKLDTFLLTPPPSVSFQHKLSTASHDSDWASSEALENLLLDESSNQSDSHLDPIEHTADVHQKRLPSSDRFVEPNTENLNQASTPADHSNNCKSNKNENVKHKTENLKTFENILRSHEKNGSINLTKFVARNVPLSKIKEITFSGTYVQDYIKHVFVKNNLVEKERKAYERVLPVLKYFKVGQMWPVPEYSFTKEILIMNDLCADNFKKTANKSLTLRESSMVLTYLAKFHTAGLMFQHKNPVEFDAIKLPAKEDGHHEFIAYLNSLSRGMSFNKCFNKTEVHALQVLIDQAKNEVKISDQYSTVCHGNLLPTNLFFKGKEVRFLDFKQMHYGSIALDVICFMAVNLAPMLYFNCHDYLLDYYFRWLTYSNKFDILVNFNYDFTFENFRKEVDKVTPYGILYAIWSIPICYANSDKELKTLRTILDNKSDDLSLEFVKRIKKLLSVYHELYITKISTVPSSNDLKNV